MIKLHGFMPLWGLPDPSPFVIKAMTLFKMAGVEYAAGAMGLDAAPKGKIPYLTLENGEKLGDSNFIKTYLERQKNADFSGGYDAKSLGIGWAAERLCEDNLYWILVHDRWGNDENFNKGPRVFFNNAPEAIREKIIAEVRDKAKNARLAHGIERHSEDEIFALGKRDIDALAAILGDNEFILGDRICGYDASIHALLWGISLEYFQSRTGEYARTKPNLMAYVARMNGLFYPEL